MSSTAGPDAATVRLQDDPMMSIAKNKVHVLFSKQEVTPSAWFNR